MIRSLRYLTAFFIRLEDCKDCKQPAVIKFCKFEGRASHAMQTFCPVIASFRCTFRLLEACDTQSPYNVTMLYRIPLHLFHMVSLIHDVHVKVCKLRGL